MNEWDMDHTGRTSFGESDMTQPEALRLANRLYDGEISYIGMCKAAAELRRLHEVNIALLAALKDALFHVANQGDLGVDQWMECEQTARAAIDKGEAK